VNPRRLSARVQRQRRETIAISRPVITKDQYVALSAVLEVEVNPLLLAQALNKVQIGFIVLGAVVTLGVGRAQFESVGVAQHPMFFENQGDDGRHREALIDPLIDAVAQVGQVRHQGQVVVRQALSVTDWNNVIDASMNAIALCIESQECLRIEEALQIHVRSLANKLHVEEVRLADRLFSGEGEHLKVMLETVDGQTEVGLIGWA